MRLLKQSTATNVVIFMAASSDHVTGLASLTLTITASKNGAAFGSITPTVTDLGSGWYNLALTTGHTDTLGDLAFHITGTAADPTDLVSRVVAVDYTDTVRFGLTALPNAAAGANGGLPLGNAAGRVDVGNWLGSAPDALSSGKLPADIKLWLASAPAALSTSGYVQAMLLRWLTDNAGGTPNALASSRVDASVGAYPGNTAQTGDNYARLGAPAGASVSADVAGVLAKTPDASHYTNARGDNLANLDAAVSTRSTLGGTAQTGDNFARLGAPVHGSIAADIAAVSGGSTTVYGESGSILFTYTVYQPNGTTPIPGAAVYVSADSGGTQRSFTQVTDDVGRVRFHLDPATVYFWRSHPQYTFQDPDPEVVS